MMTRTTVAVCTDGTAPFAESTGATGEVTAPNPATHGEAATIADGRRRQRAYLFGFSSWKTGFMPAWLPERRVFLRSDVNPAMFALTCVPRLLRYKNAEVYLWGFKAPGYIERFCRHANVPVIRVEDGFLRSVGLGADHIPPLSLCFDRTGIYYDPTCPSDLENILNTYEFDTELLQRASVGIQALLASRLSKYNVATVIESPVYGPKNRLRVLVLGQVENDMSIIKGCTHSITNTRLVRIAAEENGGAEIIYRPHPEVLARGIRPGQSHPSEVQDIAVIQSGDVALADAFDSIDRVYTITSLSGFEALMRGIPVTCLGAPFYSGWGLTDDRQPCPRRVRSRSIEEVFAAAYILYPRYMCPFTYRKISFEAALKILQTMKAVAAAA